MTANEFARLVRLDEIGEAPRAFGFVADPGERAALAMRFALVALDRLELAVEVRRDGAAVFAEGRVAADVAQACVVTGEPVSVAVDAPFALRFVPEDGGGGADEIELSDADCDTLAYSGGAVDLGEAAAETLLLALDPFPRSAGADDALRGADMAGEMDAGPLAALEALKARLGG